VKEQSHKEEMSAALRGDFQRLRDRGVSASLVPQDEREPGPEPPAAEPAPPVAGDEPAGTPVGASAVAPDEHTDEPPARGGWLSRLTGR
jgi:hypothetical protein